MRLTKKRETVCCKNNKSILLKFAGNLLDNELQSLKK